MKTSLSGLLLLCAFILTTSAVQASSRSQREHGSELFKADGCVHCHTINKDGGDKGPDLSSVGRTATPAAIRKQIVEGGKGMPPFGEILQPKELDDLIAYLRSCTAKPNK
jgi:mono/diheme cytochrome c family protein